LVIAENLVIAKIGNRVIVKPESAGFSNYPITNFGNYRFLILTITNLY